MRLEPTTVTACATCGQPVYWMAQHRACWQFEKKHGIAAPSARVARRQMAWRKRKQMETPANLTVSDLEYLERIEAECHAYAASH